MKMNGGIATSSRSEAGFSLFDLLTTVALGGILTGIAIFNFRGMNDPLASGTKGMAGYFRNVRVKAISTTSAVKVYPISATRAIAAFANKCSDTTFTADSKMIYDLPKGAVFTNTSWSICYSGRGLPTTDETIYLGNGSQISTVDVYLGGAVQTSL